MVPAVFLLTGVLFTADLGSAALGGALFGDPESQVHEIRVDGERAMVVVGPGFFAADPRGEVAEQDRTDAVLGLLEEAGPFRDIRFLILGVDGAVAPPPRRGGPVVPSAVGAGGAASVDRAWRITPPAGHYPYGAPLAGTTVAISAGHGWIYDDGAWRLQRSRVAFDGCGTCRGIVEDLSNNDLVARYLIPYLEGAGARVVVVRERELGTAADLVDDGDARYSEIGAFVDGDGDDGFGGDYRVAAADDGAQAHYRLEVVRPGPQLVTLFYRDGDNRSSTAAVDVTDAVGTTRYLADMRQFGRRFLPLGVHWFLPGGAAEITLSNAGGDGVLVADAVRVGAGIHDSGHPWWQMGASSYVPFVGAADAVLGRGEVTIRPAYAEYVGADAFISIHSNATGGSGTASGTTSYRFNCYVYSDHSADPSAEACDSPPGSDALQELVHDRLVARLRADWDPAWCDRQTRVANFGELREVSTVPATLVEIAFHDNVATPTCSDGSVPRQADNRSLHDPRFRRLVGYGLYEGALAFLAPGAPVLLSPPDHLSLRSTDDGRLRVTWRAVADAAGYRLFLARGGLAFDRGRDVEDVEATLEDLTPLEVVCARVATLSAGGVGLPGPTLCGRPRMAATAHASAEVLLVDGFDREDPWVQEVDNHLDATRRHALALAKITTFDAVADAAQDEAILSGDVSLAPYRAVIFAFGLESSVDRTFTPELQDLVAAFHASGGAVVASGAEIGYELWRTEAPADRTFVQTLFGADYQDDDAEAYDVAAVPTGLFDGLPAAQFCCGPENDDPDSYDVKWPDVYAAVGEGSAAVLAYPDGRAAAIATSAGPPTLLMGFPFEAVVDPSDRVAIMERVVAYAAPDIPVGDLDLDGLPDAWEAQYGLDPADFQDAEEDPDGDGTSSAEEYAAGTDPTQDDRPRDGGLPDLGPVDTAAQDSARDAGLPDRTGDDLPKDAGDPEPPKEGCGGCGGDGCGAGCGCRGPTGSAGAGGSLLVVLLFAVWRRRGGSGSARDSG